MEQKLVIEGSLPTMNEMVNANRTNRFKGSKLKKEATELVALYAKVQLKEITKKVHIKCTWYCENKRKDKDNIAAGLKIILDGLQVAGKLKNDGWQEIGDIYHTFDVDKKNPRVEVIFSENN